MRLRDFFLKHAPQIKRIYGVHYATQLKHYKHWEFARVVHLLTTLGVDEIQARRIASKGISRLLVSLDANIPELDDIVLGNTPTPPEPEPEPSPPRRRGRKPRKPVELLDEAPEESVLETSSTMLDTYGDE